MAVKQRRGYSEKAIFRVAVGDGADVLVDSEDFLNNDKAGDGLALRPGT